MIMSGVNTINEAPSTSRSATDFSIAAIMAGGDSCSREPSERSNSKFYFIRLPSRRLLLILNFCLAPLSVESYPEVEVDVEECSDVEESPTPKKRKSHHTNRHSKEGRESSSPEPVVGFKDFFCI